MFIEKYRKSSGTARATRTVTVAPVIVSLREGHSKAANVAIRGSDLGLKCGTKVYIRA